MAGHYVRVQEAAELLGVSPATIRWYSLQHWLPTYRVGRGRIAHRRFRYQDLARVAVRTGRFLPDEPVWDRTLPITVEMAAHYLGLSARYLTASGQMTPAVVLSWDGLMELERRIYSTPVESFDSTEFAEEGQPMMMERMMMKPGCGCGSAKMERSIEKHARTSASHGGWPLADLPSEGASLMALRRAQRHLAVQKADLEDQLSELERRIQEHPDNRA